MAENVGGISASVELEEGSLEAQLARVRQSFQTTAQQVAQVNVQFAGGGLSIEQYAAKIETLNRVQTILSAQSRSLEQQIRATNAAAAQASTGSGQLAVGLGAIGDSAGKTSNNMAFASRGIVDLSRGLEDFSTGGFIGIMNNLPGMTMNAAQAFKYTAEQAMGMATAVSLVSTAGYLLYKNWGMVQSVMGTGMEIPALKGLDALNDRLKTLDHRITELRGKGKLSLPELGELEAATEERARVRKQADEIQATERIVNGPSDEEKARGDAFAKAIRESGGGAALTSLEDALGRMADERGKVNVLGAEGERQREREIPQGLRDRLIPNQFTGVVDPAAQREVEEIRRHNAAINTPANVARELFRNAAEGNQAALKSITEALGPDHPVARRIAEEAKEAPDPERDERLQRKIDRAEPFTPQELEEAPRGIRDRYLKGRVEREELTPQEYEKAPVDVREAVKDRHLTNKVERGEAFTPEELEAAPPTLRNRYLKERAEHGELTDDERKAAGRDALEAARDRALTEKVDKGEAFTAEELKDAPRSIRNRYLKERAEHGELTDEERKDAPREVMEAEKKHRLAQKIDRGEAFTAEELKDAPRDVRDRYLRQRAEQGSLTREELAGAPVGIADKFLESRERDKTKRERLDERIHDNQYKIFQNLNPTREGQRMGLDQYDASIMGMSGETLEAKRLHQLVELQKENNRLVKERNAVGAVRRR